MGEPPLQLCISVAVYGDSTSLNTWTNLNLWPVGGNSFPQDNELKIRAQSHSGLCPYICNEDSDLPYDLNVMMI